MAGAVTTRVDGRDALAAALARAPGVPLITVSNHETALDDPLVVSALLPDGGALSSPQGLRWTLCATDRCFTSTLAAAFFRAGKVLPVARGAGLAQPGMTAAEGRLAAGEWVHVFPEGTRSRDGLLRPARKGVGRLAVAAARATGQDPILLPFAHSGMRGVLPPGAVVPRGGGVVGVAVGAPIPVATIAAAHAAAGSPGGDDGLYMAVADAVGRALAGLKVKADGLAGVATTAELPPPSFRHSHAAPTDAVIPTLADLEADDHSLLADEAACLAPRWACASPAVRAAAAAARAPAGAARVMAGGGQGGGAPTATTIASALRGASNGGLASDAVAAWARQRAAAAAAVVVGGELAARVARA